MSNPSSQNNQKEAVSSKMIIVASILSLAAILTIVAVLLSSLGRTLIPRLKTIEVRNKDSQNSELATQARLKPLTKVNIGAISTTQKAAQNPEEIFTTLCSTCHTVAATGAPLVDNKAEWENRLKAQGFDQLVYSAIHGIRAMPARGGNPKLSDDEVKGALTYMLNKAGIEVAK